MSWEFAICDGIVLAVLVYELISIRRVIRRDREAARARAAEAEGRPGQVLADC